MDNAPIIFVVGFVTVAILIVAIVDNFVLSLDRARIERYFRNRGEQLLDSKRKLRFFHLARDGRLYKVRYRDQEGNIHESECATRALRGVFFRHDEIVERAQPVQLMDVASTEALAREIEKLEEQLETLRERLAQQQQQQQQQRAR